MKKLIALLIVASAVVPLSGAAAAERPFSIQIQGTTLHIFGPDGKEIGTGLPAPTVARIIDVPPCSFQVSFGADANGNLSAILSPDPEHPASLDFTVNDRAVKMDKDSVVTITMGNNGVTTGDPGIPPGVRSEDRATPTQYVASNDAALPYQMPFDAQGTTDDRSTSPGQSATLSPLASPTGNPAPAPFNTNKKAHDILNVMTHPNLTTPF